MQMDVQDVTFQGIAKRIMQILAAINLRPNYLPPVRQRINEAYFSDQWRGNDCFAHYSRHQFEFFSVVGETVHSFLEMLDLVRFDIERVPTSKLDERNKLLMCMLWLKSYNTFVQLALMFDVSITDVSRIIHATWPVLLRVFGAYIRWPTPAQWLSMKGNWPSLPGVVGAIDATSHEIYTPGHDFRSYYSGHRKFQCVHTQIIVDNDNNIRYVYSGIQGKENDAKSYRNLPTLGPKGTTLYLPDDCWILADGIYPAEEPLVKSFRKNQMALHDPEENYRRVLYNQEHSSHRVYVEHVVGSFKNFRVISTLYRHHRSVISRVVTLCAALAQRRVDLFDNI